MAAVMIGEGFAFYKGKKLSGLEALKRVGISEMFGEDFEGES